MRARLALAATAAAVLAAMALPLAADAAAAASTADPAVRPAATGTPAPPAAATASATARETRVAARVTPADGSTVGVGMPVSVTFDKPVADRQAVAAAIRVTSSSGQPAVGHWFGPQRLDFRPEQYWKAGSDVTVELRTEGTTAGPDLLGPQDRTIAFRVGRSQVSTVDVRTRTMTVVRDGEVVRTLPVSAGAPATPTWDGQLVISQKLPVTRMSGATVGFTAPDGKASYDIPDVPHAMRLSGSGTFVHGNYWAPEDVFGTENTSHGCIGLSDARGGGDRTTPAAWFYSHSLVGDVVVVEHSGGATISPSNGLSDWNLPWQSWIRP